MNEIPLITVHKEDVPLKNERYSSKTSDGIYTYYKVICYDDENKKKRLFDIKIKNTENIISKIRLSVALEYLSKIHPLLERPDVSDDKSTEEYLEKAKRVFNIKDNIDIMYIAERYVEPNKFSNVFTYDFYEAPFCEGCRNFKKGIQEHRGEGGCFL